MKAGACRVAGDDQVQIVGAAAGYRLGKPLLQKQQVLVRREAADKKQEASLRRQTDARSRGLDRRRIAGRTELRTRRFGCNVDSFGGHLQIAHDILLRCLGNGQHTRCLPQGRANLERPETATPAFGKNQLRILLCDRIVDSHDRFLPGSQRIPRVDRWKEEHVKAMRCCGQRARGDVGQTAARRRNGSLDDCCTGRHLYDRRAQRLDLRWDRTVEEDRKVVPHASAEQR